MPCIAICYNQHKLRVIHCNLAHIESSPSSYHLVGTLPKWDCHQSVGELNYNEHIRFPSWHMGAFKFVCIDYEFIWLLYVSTFLPSPVSTDFRKTKHVQHTRGSGDDDPSIRCWWWLQHRHCSRPENSSIALCRRIPYPQNLKDKADSETTSVALQHLFGLGCNWGGTKHGII